MHWVRGDDFLVSKLIFPIVIQVVTEADQTLCECNEISVDRDGIMLEALRRQKWESLNFHLLKGENWEGSFWSTLLFWSPFSSPEKYLQSCSSYIQISEGTYWRPRASQLSTKNIDRIKSTLWIVNAGVGASPAWRTGCWSTISLTSTWIQVSGILHANLDGENSHWP